MPSLPPSRRAQAMCSRWMTLSSSSSKRNRVDLDALLLALEGKGERREAGIGTRALGKRSCADKKLTRARCGLNARGGIHRIANRREIKIFVVADIPDISDAGIDPDADGQPRPAGASKAEGREEIDRAVDRRLPEIRPGKAGDEKRHHLVADQLVDGRVAADQDLGCGIVEAVERRREFFRPQSLRKFGRAAHIGEQDSQLNLRAAKRHLLTAEGAKARILFRRNHTDGAAEKAADAAERVVAPLAARRSGKQAPEAGHEFFPKMPVPEDFSPLLRLQIAVQFVGHRKAPC